MSEAEEISGRANGINWMKARIATLEARLAVAVGALNKMAAWGEGDGPVGSHFDEPYAAGVSRATLLKIGAPHSEAPSK